MKGIQFVRPISVKIYLYRFYTITHLVSAISCSYSPTLPSSGSILHSVFLYCGQFQSVSQCMRCRHYNCCFFCCCNKLLQSQLLLWRLAANIVLATYWYCCCFCYCDYGGRQVARTESPFPGLYSFSPLNNLVWRGGALSVLQTDQGRGQVVLAKGLIMSRGFRLSWVKTMGWEDIN